MLKSLTPNSTPNITVVDLHPLEGFEDTEGLIQIRQHNGQNKKDKGTKNDL